MNSSRKNSGSPEAVNAEVATTLSVCFGLLSMKAFMDASESFDGVEAASFEPALEDAGSDNDDLVSFNND
ncbi:hypothetical protein BCU36_023715 [Vibrio lentus]|uniref:hypothetical protein n=1 Tax=Vibrio lentus TaxID=136468 RepID=UPI0039A749B4